MFWEFSLYSIYYVGDVTSVLYMLCILAIEGTCLRFLALFGLLNAAY